MAKVISSLPGSTGILSRTSQLTNDGESGVSTYVELNDLSTVATTGDYNNLINVPIDFTPKVHTHNISDISGTKSEFNTSLIDGNFLFEGDITQYTDELAQDAIGSILTDTATINFSYDDTTPTVSANVKLNSIDATHLTDGINITEFTNNANYETTSQLNIRDTNNRNRVNHTGEQPISTVTGLQTNLDLKQDALGFTPENVANKSTELTASSTLYPTNNAVIVALATKEDKANKVTSIGSSANDTNYPSELAVKTYADNLVVGMLNDKGTWDASGNVFPTTGGSGVGGVIRKGDMWYVSVAGTLGTKSVNVGDCFRALVNAPSQVAANWSILEANIGYVPANDSNVVHLTGAETITGAKTFNDISAVTNYKSSTSNVIISDTDGLVFRGVRSGAWLDSVNTRFFQVGNSNDNVVFSTRFGYAANRMLFSSLKTQISSGNFVSTIVPIGIFEVTNGTNRFFNVFESGNSVFGGSPDDLTNRLQVTGTVSSGTTALGNTPPTANNQLTRKDYVDTGLASKEPSFTKNTAFNKNFGTIAGTVAEGNDGRLSDSRNPLSGSSNYIQNGTARQTANLNISGSVTAGDGTLKGESTATKNRLLFFDKSGGFGTTSFFQNYSNTFFANGKSMEIEIEAIPMIQLATNNTGTDGKVIFPTGNVGIGTVTPSEKLEVNGNIKATSATFSSTVTAAPATLSNHVVVKSQLDAVANIAGTSDNFSTTVTNAVNVSGFFIDSATYTKIGNIINANVSMSLSSSMAGLSTFNLTLPFAKGNTSGAAVGSGSALTSITVFPVSVRSLNSTTAFVSVHTPSASNMLVSVNFQYDITK